MHIDLHALQLQLYFTEQTALWNRLLSFKFEIADVLLHHTSTACLQPS